MIWTTFLQSMFLKPSARRPFCTVQVPASAGYCSKLLVSLGLAHCWYWLLLSIVPSRSLSSCTVHIPSKCLMRSGLSFSYMISLNLIGCSFPVYLFLPRCWALTSSEGGWPSTSISSKSIDCRKEEACLSDTVWFRSGTHIKNKKLKKLMLTAITLNDS